MRRIHLDHNATTHLRDEARATWLEVTDELGGNASSLHAAGRRARQRIDEARERVAGALGVAEDEIVFTSGGTESNNLALFGLTHGPGNERRGLITTAVEHSSVLEAARALGRRGHPLTLAPVDAACRVDPAEVAGAVTQDTGLVSVMAANNEVGSLSDLAGIRAALEGAGGGPPRFHTDAVQALGRVPVRLADWGVDAASFSAHKAGGPVGVGILWRRAGVTLESLLFGGEQESALRPGTEDVAGIAAASIAIELAVNEQETFRERSIGLARSLWCELESCLPSARLLGPHVDEHERLPNTLCVLVPEADGKVLVTRLDLEGLEASAGSACASGSLEPSHVLLAMGLQEDEARAALRLSLGRNTTREECKLATDILRKLFVSSRAT